MEKAGGVLDLRCTGKQAQQAMPSVPSAVPLDLSIPRGERGQCIRSGSHFRISDLLGLDRGSPTVRVKKEFQISEIKAESNYLLRNDHQSVGKSEKIQFTPCLNPLPHLPSKVEADSSIESEQGSDYINYPAWYVQCNAVNIRTVCERRDSVESIERRESVSSVDHQDSVCTDTENERDSSGPESNYQDPSSLLGTTPQIGSFTVLKAEVIDVKDIHAELLIPTEEENDNYDDDDEGELQVDETCIGDLFRGQISANEGSHSAYQRSTSTSSTVSSFSATIQDKATMYLAEIKKSRICVEIEKEQDNIKRYCIKCQDVFHSNAALLRHLMTHSSRNPGEKLIKCPVCTKRFSTVGAIERHIMKLHTGDMPFVCEVCDTPFKFHTHLQRHLTSTRCSSGIPRKKKQLAPKMVKVRKSRKRSTVVV